MYFETETLEYNKILIKITSYARYGRTKDLIQEIKPFNDAQIIDKMLNETEEMRQFIISFGEFPFGNGIDIYKHIQFALKGGVLEGVNLKHINDFIKTTNNIKRTKTTLASQFRFNYLSNFIDSLIDMTKLSNEITKAIDEVGNILDNASMQLFSIRKQVKMLETRLRNRLQEILISKSKELSDNVIVIRNERLCLAVKAEYKNSFKGIIHDQSSSGNTFYIEPIVTFEINNQLINEQANEKQEVTRILAMLSSNIMGYADELFSNIDNVISLDIISAKAQYGKEFVKPTINEKGIVELEKAIHPLLDSKKAVPLDIRLGDKYQTIIITGPNTGGKTVSLKTVGLLTLMMQSGMLIPAKEAKMAVFDNVFCDIGDEQSIEQSLSTFSSHMSKIVKITHKITENSLVLLDELGGGTDPIEGSALAISLLNYFMEKKARIIITTHYPTLKAYGYENDFIQNASMEFNEETYMPTYRLLQGISGKSNAFLISKYLGLNEQIIENANAFILENTTEESKLMKKIEEEGLYLDKIINENERLKQELLNKEKEYDKKIKSLEEKKEQIIKKSQNKADKLYEEAKEKAYHLLREIETLLKENTKQHEVANVKHKIKELKTKNEIGVNERKLIIGDYVEIISYGCIGEILSIKDNKYSVRFGNLTSTFSDYELKFSYSKPEEQKPLQYVPTERKSVSTSLDLRGFRYEDAKSALDKYIDDAIYAKLNTITIIHGFGTGTIRKLVHEYLKNSKHIEKFRFGGMGEGLNGVTIAYLK